MLLVDRDGRYLTCEPRTYQAQSGGLLANQHAWERIELMYDDGTLANSGSVRMARLTGGAYFAAIEGELHRVDRANWTMVGGWVAGWLGGWGRRNGAVCARVGPPPPPPPLTSPPAPPLTGSRGPVVDGWSSSHADRHLFV